MRKQTSGEGTPEDWWRAAERAAINEWNQRSDKQEIQMRNPIDDLETQPADSWFYMHSVYQNTVAEVELRADGESCIPSQAELRHALDRLLYAIEDWDSVRIIITKPGRKNRDREQN